MLYILLKFIICAILIFIIGKRVAQYGDIITEKTGLGGVWIGIILVAFATSIPEIFTGIGSTVFVDAPDLTAGNLFGANAYNLLNLALLDFLYNGPPLLNVVSVGQLLTAVLSLIPLMIAASGIFLIPRLPQVAYANISLFSILIFAVYLFSARTIFKFERHQHKIKEELEKEGQALAKYVNIPFKRAVLLFSVNALLLAALGIWLSFIGDELAQILNLSKSFVGSLFLGFATTLPEVAVSVSALLLGARELAVSNLIGSNLFNMAIIFLNDIFYRKVPIFTAMSQQHIFTSFVVIVMTTIVCAALILKPKKKLVMRMSSYSILLIITFILGTYINFQIK